MLAPTARSQAPLPASLNELNQAIEASGKFDREKLAHIEGLKKPFLDNKNGDLDTRLEKFKNLINQQI